MPLSNEQKLALYRNLARAMTLDRLMLRLIRTGKLVGFYHEGGIALAPGVAAGSFLRKTDVMSPHYRAHGLAHLLSKGIDPKAYVAEHMGRTTGCCKGRSSYHWSFPAFHVFGSSGNIGANFPACVGYGFAAKYKKSGQIVMNCSGDGSYAEGRSHEGMLMAANWQLPIIFWCENNSMAQHTAITETFPSQHPSDLAGGYGIPARVVDGQDLFACGEAALAAIDHVRSGKGPIFIECTVLRVHEHSVGSANKAGTVTRDPKLMAHWRETRDPEMLAAQSLIAQEAATRAQLDEIKAAAAREAAEIEEFCDQSPKATPPIDELMRSVYAA